MTESLLGSYTDPRDGQTYKTVSIGGQVWMAENLNFHMDRSYCCNNNPANCIEYGRLYSWDAAMKVCPTGWHLPSIDEWEHLIDHLGGGDVAGYKMKSRDGWKWNDDYGISGNGDNSSGFNALPGGYRLSNGGFGVFLERAHWWSATEIMQDSACGVVLGFDSNHCDMGNYVSTNVNYKDEFWFSVRCLKN